MTKPFISDQPLYVQAIEVNPSLPGFALGDTPIMHGHPPTNRYGIPDRPALLNTGLIFGPLSHSVGVCLNTHPLPTVHVRTRRKLDTLNGLTTRAAPSEVACHPDDTKTVRHARQQLERLDPSFLIGPG